MSSRKTSAFAKLSSWSEIDSDFARKMELFRQVLRLVDRDPSNAMRARLGSNLDISVSHSQGQ